MHTKIAEILQKIIDGEPCYRLDGQYIRWGAVQRDLNEVVSESVKQREREIVEWLKKDAMSGNYFNFAEDVIAKRLEAWLGKE